ncbi:MAG: M16 family metallopeptidase [Myxococcales bacterium]
MPLFRGRRSPLHKRPSLPKLAPPRPLDPRLFEVKEHVLANGLRIRLLEDHSVPATTLYTFFRVGSRNERPGITGIAHLFEHMMFNGAAKYGPKEFDRLLEGNGGQSNAYTSNDVTAYFEDFATEALELVLDLESDRMRSLAITPEMLESEREVVKEERRLHVDNETMGLLDEELFAISYAAHPYRWPVIGWMSDIESIQREDCLEFFRTYYAPNNASLWLVGDFRSEQVLKLIERYYGDIPSGPPIPAFTLAESPQRGERRSEVHFPAQAHALAVGYKGTRACDPDTPVLDVLQYALSAGEGARLVRALEYDQVLAADVLVDFPWKIDPGLFVVLADLNPGVKPEKALAVIDRELQRIAEKGIGERELARAKGLLRAHHLREMAPNSGRAHALGQHEVIVGDWRSAIELSSRYAAVTNADVKRVARALFEPNRRSVVTLVPEKPASRRKGAARG